MSNNDDKQSEKLFTVGTSKILSWAGLVLIILSLFFFLWRETFFDTSLLLNSGKAGQFGDFVGGIIGSLWAFAGVILFYVALTEQRMDFAINKKTLDTQVAALEKQIQEFELQRDEMKLSREVYTEQSNTLKKQQFENTFFNMVGLHHKIVEGLKIDTIELDDSKDHLKRLNLTGVLSSRVCFFLFFMELQANYLKREKILVSNKTSYEPNNLIVLTYEDLYNKFQSDLSHYFGTLYNILKFIKSQQVGDDFFYANIFRAQLSSYELLLLFYHCSSKYGSSKFKSLIEDYSLFKFMPDKFLIEPDENKKLYKIKAFKDIPQEE